jgi:hypothetical protein
MKAVELIGTVNTNGQINLDQALTFPYGSRVKVIVLLPELICTEESVVPGNYSVLFSVLIQALP